jgi:hypothetical protein
VKTRLPAYYLWGRMSIYNILVIEKGRVFYDSVDEKLVAVCLLGFLFLSSPSRPSSVKAPLWSVSLFLMSLISSCGHGVST